MVSINLNNKNLWSIGLNVNTPSTKLQPKKEETLTLRTDLQIDGFVRSEDSNAKTMAVETWKDPNGNTIIFDRPDNANPKTKVEVRLIDKEHGIYITTKKIKDIEKWLNNHNYTQEK